MGRQLTGVLLGTLVDGSLYALLGTGFVILFRCTGVINFAQGALMALAGYAYLVATDLGLAWPLALLASVVAVGVLGALLYLVVFRRLVGASLFSMVIATLGLATTVTVVMNVVWGPDTRNLASPFAKAALFRVAGAPIGPLDVYVVVAAIIFVAAADALIQATRLGTRMRAVADSPLLAGLMKVNVHQVSAAAWALAGALTAVAGVAFALRSTIDPVSAQGYGLVAFAAVLIGGLDSLRGAVIGGLALAAIQAVVVAIIGAEWAEIVAYLALVLVLFTRPQGIFGSPSAVRI
ncbi:MAG: branched-chain amino acid ABC transporter permease [Candidatus Dormibacteria bacterium]